MVLFSYPAVKLGSFSARTPLWGEDADLQTPIKEIAGRVGKATLPGYADEMKKDDNYKIFVHKRMTEEQKENSKKMR